MNENSVIFSDWKKSVENVNILSKVDCLRIVEVNISNVCNMKCPFCPQSIKMQYALDYADVHMIKCFANQLHDMHYAGYICIAGHGEPTLHPKFIEILNVLKDFNVVLVTNGSQFSNQTWKNISQLCQIKVSIHDWANRQTYFDRFSGSNAVFRNHDMHNPQMNIYNRAGCMHKIENNNDLALRRCNYPFYKTMIDVDGSYLICEADWTTHSKTSINVFNTCIADYFCNDLSKYRRLMNTGRNNIDCCKECNIDGQLIGNKFVDYMNSHET